MYMYGKCAKKLYNLNLITIIMLLIIKIKYRVVVFICINYY